MTINFPTSLDSLTNPTPTDQVSSSTVPHATQHADANDAIEALEAKVGVDSSAVTTSLDYKIRNIPDASLALTDVTTNDVTSTKHGFAPKSPADATKFLNGAATPAYALVKDSDLSVSDITTNNASTSSHGFLKKLSGSATEFMNGTGAWAAVSGGGTAFTLIPKPTGSPVTANLTDVTVNTNTTAFVGMLIIPFNITVNKITIRTSTVNTAGTYDLSLYSEDGQTRLFSVTTGSVSANSTLYTTAVSAVAVPAGNYYIMVNPNGTADASLKFWGTNSSSGFDTSQGFDFDVASEPILMGSLTITAGTPPATISPTGITEATERTICVRLDN